LDDVDGVRTGDRVARLLSQREAHQVQAQRLYERALAAYEKAQAAATQEKWELVELRRDRAQLALVAERERIAREVQAGSIRTLFEVGMQLQSIMSRNPDNHISAELQGCVDDLDRALRELRGYIFGLDPRLSSH
jgi:signal transduction histidine kinase